MLSRRFLRIKVVKALYEHFTSGASSVVVSEKNMMASIDKAYSLYFQMLYLSVEVARYAEKRIEIAKNKKLPTQEELNPNMKFVENRVIRQFDECDTLCDKYAKSCPGWGANPEFIKHIYTCMTESEYFKAYMTNGESSYKDDARFLVDFYVNTVQDNTQLENLIEEQSILWIDDLDFILFMVVRTIDASRGKQTRVPILPQYKNEDDQNFVKELFRHAVLHYNDYVKSIEQFTRNWDSERIAFMDMLIMVATISEMVAFDSIPVKVTLDEYIEIAKYYSSPGSSLFINGVLDKVVNSFKEDGRINKFGRGLVEK